MPKYIVHYFDIPGGRAEPIRMMFHCAGVEFEDRKIKKEDWPEFKKSNGDLLPFGQVPVLEVDGTVIAQSFAILSYLADEFGMHGKTNLERAKCTMLYHGLIDIFQKLATCLRETDEAKKANILREFLGTQLPDSLRVYEEKFVPKEGFLLGEDVSLADICLSLSMDKQPVSPEAFPRITALCERVKNIPNLKKYMDSKK